MNKWYSYDEPEPEDSERSLPAGWLIGLVPCFLFIGALGFVIGRLTA